MHKQIEPFLLIDPPGADVLYVLAHGAGAPMTHPFMEALAQALARHGVATLRYDFPYMRAGSKRPDPKPKLIETVRLALAEGVRRAGGRRLIAGGKSMGGRMTSMAEAEHRTPEVLGLAFVGFPLHPPKKVSRARAEHLQDVEQPLLFLQGTRDALCDLTLMREVARDLSERATLHEVREADHGFAVLKRSGRTAEDVLEELASTIAAWARAL